MPTDECPLPTRRDLNPIAVAAICGMTFALIAIGVGIAVRGC